MKQDPILPNKIIHSNNSSRKHFLITITPLDNNHRTYITIAEGLQIKVNHEIFHKKDLVDQTVKTINFETTIPDQSQTEVIAQIITEIVQTQTPEIDIIKRPF